MGLVCVSLVLSSTEKSPLSPFPAGTLVLCSGTSTPLAPLGHLLFGIFDHWEFSCIVQPFLCSPLHFS